MLIAIDMRLVDWLRLKLFPAIRHDIILSMYQYLNQHSHHYFQNHFAGSLSNKIADMQLGVVNVLSTIDDGFAQLCGLIIAIITMYFVHPLFSIILLLWAITFFGIALWYFKPIMKLSHVFATSKTLTMGKLVDSIGNISNIRLFSRTAFENRYIADATLDTITKDRQMQWYLLRMRILWDLSIVILIASNILLLVYMYSQNQVSIGDFSFIISLSISIYFNVWHLASQFVQVAEELGKCRQALSIITIPHEIQDKPDAKPLVITQGKIEFRQVNFHYEKNPLLFSELNLVIEGGQKIGLVGYSGSGKSTFINLLLRLFDIQSGEILIDGQNIQNVTQDSLREHLAMIPQDISLFHRSLSENIRYGRIAATDQELLAASQQAFCHDFISELPDGYDALVGERGIKLSGGQRQRIAIARAILKNAPILILDEATSALDSMTEKQIQTALHQLMQNRTTLVIAHRLSTLAEMDRIIVLDRGQIIEAGSHSELLKANGHYAALWKLQAGGFLITERP